MCCLAREGRMRRDEKSLNFPVFFPVSREFSRRKVSAGLRAPPYSLRCRGFLSGFPRKQSIIAAILRIFRATRTRETGAFGFARASSPRFLCEQNWQSGFDR